MIDLDYTFFIQLVNFLIILTVLNLILFRPIRGIIKKRAQVVDEKLRAIENFTTDAETKVRSYKEALGGSRIEAQGVRLSLKEEGLAVEVDTLSLAATEAADKLAAARNEIEKQKKAALKSLRTEVAGYAKGVAQKVLSKA